MTPAAPAGAQAPPTDTARSANAPEHTIPGRRSKRRGRLPRRISGPMAAPAAPSVRPRPQKPRPEKPHRATTDRPKTVRRPGSGQSETFSERLGVFLRSLPDHALLDRVVRGRAWIPLLGVMLVGIIAMQVELLKLNASTGRSIELTSSLQSRNDSLRIQVASASDPNRIERLATRMGMTMPSPEAITFVRARTASVARALAAIHVPNAAASITTTTTTATSTAATTPAPQTTAPPATVP